MGGFDSLLSLNVYRALGIVKEKWYGSLLEQYAGFLNWFKGEFEGRYWHGLAWEMVRRFKEEEISAPQ